MKKLIPAALVLFTVIGLTLSRLHRSQPIATPAAVAASPAATPQNTPLTTPTTALATTAQVPPAPNPASIEDAWTARLRVTLAPSGIVNEAAITQFNMWLAAYQTNPAAADLNVGESLARERRAALKDLIKTDAEHAWGFMLSASARATLPVSIQSLLETPIQARGDWEPYAICDSTLPFSQYQEVTFASGTPNASRYYGFPVGPLVDGGTVRGLELTGYIIDDIGAFTGNPPRNLTAGEPLPPHIPIETHDPFTGREVVSAETLHNGLLPDGLAARFDGTRIVLFESEHNRERYEAADQPADPPADEPSTGEAPGLSTTGQRDSLPFSAKTKTVSLGYRTLIYIPIAFSDKTASPQSESSCYSMLREVNDEIIKDSHGRMQLLPTVTPLIVLPNTEAYYTNQGTGKLMSDAQAAAVALGYNWAHYSHRVVRYNGGPGTFGGLASVNADPGNIWMRFSSKQILIHEIGHNYGLSHSHYWNGSRKSANGPGSSVEYGHSFDPMGAAYENWPNYVFCSYQKQKIGWLKSTEWTAVRGNGRYRIGAIDDRSIDPAYTTALRITRSDGRNYWAEFRRRFNNNPFNNGLLLQGTGWYSSSRPDLFDVTYWSSDGKGDSTIPIGYTYRDVENSIFITPVGRDNSNREWMDVQVNLGPFPSNQPPVVSSFTASSLTPGTGASINLNVTATDPDGDELAYHWYYDDNEFHRNLNQSSTSKSWSSAGIYVVICRVSDMKGGEAVVRLPITVGAAGSTFTVSGRVTDHAGVPYVGVPVDNNLATDAANYRVTMTDTNGDYTLARVVSGTYNIHARTEGDGVNTGNVNVNANLSNVNITGRALRITPVGTSLAENGGSAQFLVERVGGVTGDFLAVPIVLSGAAIKGTDYSITPALTSSNTFNLLAASPSQLFTITGLNDATAEGPEDVVMSLGPVDNLTQHGPTFGVLTINDDDTANPRVRLEALDGRLIENGSAGTLRVVRFGNTNSALAVPLTTSGSATYNNDYTFSSGALSVTIPAGADFADLLVQPMNDGTVEGRETITVALGSGSFAKDAQNSVTLQLADDETPVVTASTPDNTASESGASGVVRFTRSNTSSSALNVEYCVRGTALHGTDYSQLSGIATIPANTSFVDVTITGLADFIAESTETAIVSAAENDTLYALGSVVEDTVNIADVPSAQVSSTLVADRSVSTPNDLIRLDWTLGNADWARLTGPGGLNLDATVATQYTAQLWQLVSPNLTTPTNLTWTLQATNLVGAVTNSVTVFVQRDIGLTATNLGGNVPTESVEIASATGTGTAATSLGDRSAAPADSFRGQTFRAPQDFLLNRVTVRVRDIPTFLSPSARLIKLEIWSFDDASQFVDGQAATGANLLGVATGQFPATAAAGDYITLMLTSPVSLSTGSDYGFVIRWNTSVGNSITLDRTANTFPNGVLLSSTTRPMTTVFGEDLVFFIQSAVSGSLDSDNDGMSDAWELTWFGTLNRNGLGDLDGDGLNDLGEFKANTNPTVGDTDGDGYSDAFEVANGFNPNGSNAIFRWTGSTSGGDGFSLYQEANWTQLNGSGAALTINPNTPVTHDLYITNGNIGGGGGFSASLDLGSKTLHFSSSGTFKGQAAAGITGTSAGLARIGGGSPSFKFLDSIRVETTGQPQITFYPGTPFTGGSVMNILELSSPRLTLQGMSVATAISTVLPSILIEGQPAISGENVQVTAMNTTNVLIMRADDTDGDGMNDPFEYQYGFNPVNPADGALDLDNDGTPNWLESRLGTAPNNAAQKLAFAFAGFTVDGKPRLQFSGGPNLNYQVQFKAQWADDWQAMDELTTDGAAQPPTLELHHANPPANALYRLRITNASP